MNMQIELINKTEIQVKWGIKNVDTQTGTLRGKPHKKKKKRQKRLVIIRI